MRSLWLKAVIILAAIWAVAGGAIYWARSVKVTPESLTKYVEKHSIEGKTGRARAKIIEEVAEQMNALGYEERREFRMGRKLDGFFKALTPDEQGRFLDLTLPTGFKQMMDSLNKMDPQQRKRFVERSLKDMQRDGENPPDGGLDANARKIIDQGFKSFYSEASADVKMDVAPLIEQLQKNLQGLR
jgi:hypothetical protein